MKHLAEQPIGIFDSGIGGLTVANAICHSSLPHESIIYFGDTIHLLMVISLLMPSGTTH